MADSDGHSTSIVGIVGQSNNDLYVLANLYHEPFDAESVLSVVVTLKHRPDVVWQSAYSAEAWCTAMDRCGTSLFLVTMDGDLHVRRDSVWQTYPTGCTDGLNSVWAADEATAFAVGLTGARVLFTGASVRVDADARKKRFNAVHGTSLHNVVAVGDGGVVCRYDGKQWSEVECPTNVNLTAVFCTTDDSFFVAGAGGVLLMWDGVGFVDIEGIDSTITDVRECGGILYAAAGRSGVFRLVSGHMESVKVLLVYRLAAVGDLLFAVGNRLVAQFDGTQWWGGELDL